MTRPLAAGLIIVAILAGSGQAQAPTPPGPVFEVASIRPVEFGGGRGPGPGRGRGPGGPGGLKIQGDRLDLPFVSMRDLLPYAFRAKDYQVTAPSWVRESFWTISAKLPAGATPDQVPDMMRALLVERFKLTIHHEQRERSVATLTQAPGGAKLESASTESAPVWDGSFPGFSFGGPLRTGAPISGRMSPGKNCARRWEFVPLTMTGLADALTIFLARPVVDKTGMTGTYKVTLEVPAETEAGMMTNMMAGRGLPPPGAGPRGGRGGPGGEPPPPPPPGLVAPGCADPISLVMEGVSAPDAALTKALQQLGLRLQSGKAPIDTVVVDHLEKTPTEN